MQTTNNLVHFLVYVLFFGFSWRCKIKGIHRLINDEGAFTSKPQSLIGTHFIGIIWFGLIPVMLLKNSVIKVLTSDKIPGSFLVFLFILVFILLITTAFKQSKTAYEKKQGSNKNFVHLSTSFFISYFIIRALFLFAYELWFRGFLLFACIHWFGIPMAVSVNIFLYVLLHIFNNKKELLACIPFGLMVCLFSILFNTAWPAIILHIGFSLVYELNIYRLNLINAKTVTS